MAKAKSYAVLLDAPAEATSRIEIARLGPVEHPTYGTFEIDESDVNSWREGLGVLPGGKALIDADHSADRAPRRSRAYGWLDAIELEADGRVMGRVTWTPRGRKAVASKEFLFVSPTYGAWTSRDGTEYKNVLHGVSLTNRPALTDLSPIVLAAPERVALAGDAVRLLDVGEGDRGEEWRALRKKVKAKARQLDVNPGALGLGGGKKKKQKTSRTLEQRALDQARMLDEARRELAASHVERQAALAQLDRDRFAAAFDAALKARKVTPGEREGLAKLFTLDQVTVLESLALRAPVLPAGPIGAPSIEFGPFDPEVFDRDEAEREGVVGSSVLLDQRVRDRLRETNRPITDYADALKEIASTS